MELKERLAHLLTIVAFPLQIVAWVFFSYDALALILPIILTVFAHGVYYFKAIMQGEKVYQLHFFYFQVVVAIAMWVTFFIKIFGYFPEFWIFIIPMFVQVGACLALHFHIRKQESVGDSAQLCNGSMAPNEAEAGSYHNMPREFQAFPVAQKTDYDTL